MRCCSHANIPQGRISPRGDTLSPRGLCAGSSPSTVTPSSTPSNPRRCGGAELHAASSSASCRLPAFLALYRICDFLRHQHHLLPACPTLRPRREPHGPARSGWRRPPRSRRSLYRSARSCRGRPRSARARLSERALEPAPSHREARTKDQFFGRHALYLRRAFHVSQLAPAAVAACFPRSHPRKMSLVACINRWPASTRCPRFL